MLVFFMAAASSLPLLPYPDTESRNGRRVR